MKFYSIVKINSDAYLLTSDVAGPGTSIGDNHVVYSQTFDGGVNIDPDENSKAVSFDNHAPIQELLRESFFQLKEEHPEVFYPVAAEPAQDPRYKTLMTSSEFVRDVLTKNEVESIGALQATDPSVWAWAYITSAGNISVNHPDFAPGIQLGVDRGVWTAERGAEISKGLLIV